VDLLDLVLIVAMVLFGISGYRQGFAVGVLSFAGFLGGGMAGVLIAPPLADKLVTGDTKALVGIATVLVLASLGQLLGTSIGAVLRKKLTWKPARLVDSAGGAAVSAVGVLLIGWLLGTAVAESSWVGLAQQVHRSRVIATVDQVMPDATNVFGAFRQLLDQRGFPTVFADIGQDPGAKVPAPDPAVVNSRAVQVARNRILKITGVARSCSRRLEGTGFVYAPERVMTNAHVVAGVRQPQVEVSKNTRLDARVVLYDPARDVAVLYVPGLKLAPLSFDGGAGTGDSAIVAGYPEDGPFNVVAARVRERITAVGRDIYERRTVRRDVYSLRTRVRPGNSGGPLLAPDGRVYGVIFAAAADDPDTGYALTASEVAPDATRGRTATQAVSTQGCD
jgi:S1-C subfamily serine protease